MSMVVAISRSAAAVKSG